MRPLLLAACLMIAAPGAAIAVPITVTFDVTSIARSTNDDPLGVYPGGVVGSGFFTFDDVLPAGAQFDDVVVGLPVIEAGFSWFGVTFDESRIRIFALVKDELGRLVAWGIGSDQTGSAFCQPLNCVNHGGTIDDFYAVGLLDATLAGLPPGTFSMAVMGRAGFLGAAYGEGTTSVSVPEPSTLSLLGAALLLGFARRRRRTG